MFVGRERDLKDLGALWGRDHGVLVTCRGRRRIGKSTLIEEFAARSGARFICIEGLAPRKGMTDAIQRRWFCDKVAEQSGRDAVYSATWSLAFAQLDGLLASGRRTVVLLDEISWLGGYDPDFAGYLKEAWDRKFRRHPDLVLGNLQTLFPMLGLESSLVLSAAPYHQRATADREGCQIDLMIQTQRMLMIVEIKRRREIGHEIIDEVDAKARKLKYRDGLSLRTALVYDGRLSPSVAADRYFDFLIPADRFFTKF